jgi:acetyl esterase/lipase
MLLAAVILLLFLTCWSIVPAPVMLLFPLAVGGPELSPWLIGAAVLIGLPARKRRRAVYLTCALSIFCSAVPLISRLASRGTRAAAFREVVGPHPDAVDSRVHAVVTRPNVPYPVRGAVLHMTVYQAAEPGQYPAIVMIYGGAWRNGTPEDNADFARHMASRGYVVCAIDYRHAPQFQFPVQLEDVEDSLVFIRQHAAELQIDVNRLALLGRSSGGHLALLAAYQPSLAPVRAVVTYYAPTDLIGGYEDLPVPDPIRVRGVLENFLGGPPAQLRERYLQASPVTYATRPLPPTLLIQGGRDHIVKPRFARELHQRLRATGTQAVLLEIPWAEHAFDAIFTGTGNREALDYTERFLAWAMK